MKRWVFIVIFSLGVCLLFFGANTPWKVKNDIIGKTINHKYGAVLLVDEGHMRLNGDECFIQGLDSWPDEFLNKKVRLYGKKIVQVQGRTITDSTGTTLFVPFFVILKPRNKPYHNKISIVNN